jgi:hypothetical protein
MVTHRKSSALFLALLLSFCFAASAQSNNANDVEKRVKSLINQMTNHSTEQKAFADLEALGCSAVPAIIANIDDRRKLPDRSIALKNKMPGAWEARRLYGPEKVVDALDAILNQQTGHGGSIVNGGTDQERTEAAKAWREWLAKTPADKRCFADVKP